MFRRSVLVACLFYYNMKHVFFVSEHVQWSKFFLGVLLW